MREENILNFKIIKLVLTFAIILTGSLAISAPNESQLNINDNDSSLTKAIEYIMEGDFGNAVMAAERSSNPSYALSVIEILKIYNNPTAIPLSSAAAFLEKYSWVPQEVFLPKIERSINHETNSLDIINWFTYKAPITNRGKFFLIHANITQGKIDTNDIKNINLFRQLWRTTEFDVSAEEYIIMRYKNLFTVQDLFDKIDYLIWHNSLTFASKLVSILPIEYQSSLKQKIELARMPDSVFKFISRNRGGKDEFTNYCYIKTLIKNKNIVEALKQLGSIKPKSNFDKWWKLKNFAFREALNNRKFLLAYNIIQNHGLEEGAEFADAEWYAGWTVLTFLNKPKSAIKHFSKMYGKTKLANSKSKAAYWLARAYQKDKNEVLAKKWFNESSIYSSTFYGQLAIARIHGAAKYNYFDSYKNHKDKITTQLDKDKIRKITLLAYHLYNAGQKMLAYDVINYIPSLKLDRSDLELSARFFTQNGLKPLAVELSKASANKSFVLVKEGYPKDIKINKHALPQGLYLAIIRQESNFDSVAVSPAGARGLMQLMPDTAAKLAKTLGLPKLSYINDPSANVLKGSTYVDQLYSQYNNLILTIAAYNAGPGNVRKWIDLIGDPRNMTTVDEKINWIESIPFAETRSYVKKVLENLVIYNSMLDSNHHAKTILMLLEL